MDSKRGGLFALVVVFVVGIIGAILGFTLGLHKADDPGMHKRGNGRYYMR